MPEMSVQQFYAGKNVFITGGSGFVGICLIEKLLRCSPDLGKIYMLLRPKKGKEITERMEDIKKNSVFENFYTDKSEEDREALFAKIVPVAGDIGRPGLGLSDADRAMLCKEVNVVFHSAASLDFELGLRSNVEANILGTRKVTELCADIHNLNCLVHVSSAYVNSWRSEAEEVVYPLAEDVDKVVELVRSKSDEELAQLLPSVLKDHINSYTFTKHLAELEVQKCEQRFPCTIVRPSMITAAAKEPNPGWTISKNGPQGFLMGASKGVIRRLPVSKSLVYDYIPVDVVVNNLLVAGYHVTLNKSRSVEVYHCTSSTRKPFRWELVEEHINGYLHKYPLKSAVWYPHLKFLPSLAWFRVSALFVHVLPALLLDTVTRIAGGRPILMRLHRNVNASLDLLQRFIFSEWRYNADNTDKLHNWLLPDDKLTFGVSLAFLDWRDYFIDLTQGVRKYLSKENPKSLDVARSKDNMLMIFHYMLMAGIVGTVWFLAACLLGSTMSKTMVAVPITYFLLNFL